MKILYLTSRFPHPLEKGDKLRAYYQMKALSKEHEIYLVSIIDQDPDKKDLEKLKEICTEVYCIHIKPMERYVSLARAVFSNLPFQIAYFYNHQAAKNIVQIATAIQPDHIFCQLTRMSEYARKLPYPRTLDYMDCFSVSMQRRSMVATKWQAWLYKKEALRMMDYEATISDEFDHLTIISEQDRDQFKFENACNIQVIPNGISPSFFDYNNAIDKMYDIVFVGNMSYLPNIEAAEYIIHQILPQLNSDIKVLLAGAQPSPRIHNLAGPHVHVSGWMDDIRVAYASGKIFVAPMWTGTGQQNKILEAMAMGIPCITTHVVNNAILATENEEILLAETDKEFTNAILKLLSDAQLYDKLSVKSRRFVRENYDWNKTGHLLAQLFKNNYKSNAS